MSREFKKAVLSELGVFGAYIIGFLFLLYVHASFNTFIYYIFIGFVIIALTFCIIAIWSARKFLGSKK